MQSRCRLIVLRIVCGVLFLLVRIGCCSPLWAIVRLVRLVLVVVC
jgi:hypothetical protein